VGVAGSQAMAEEAGVDVGDERPMGCRKRPQGLVQLGKPVQRRRPGRQVEPAGVPAAVARIVDGGDYDRRVRPIRSRKPARTLRPFSTTVVITRRAAAASP
jgi:hypothetical protein